MNDNSRLDDRKSYLQHYGTPRHSGRYPWGSGVDPYQHGGADFLGRVESLKKQGLSESQIRKSLGVTTEEYKNMKMIAKNEREKSTDFISKIEEQQNKGIKSDTKIAEALGMKSTKYRALRGVARSQRRANEVNIAKTLSAQGKNPTEIARIMGKPGESSVRSLLDSKSEANMSKAETAAKLIREQVDERGMIDVGEGVEREIGVSKEKMAQALEILQNEGYKVYSIGIPQTTNLNQRTPTRVIGPSNTSKSDPYKKQGEIQPFKTSYREGTYITKAAKHPTSIDSSRVAIRYAEDGGQNKDGLIEIRPGVEDLSLGNSHYAQVRIAVDKTHYLKGMAVYSDDVPEGKDIIFNTNKPSSTPKMEVLKKLSDDKDNPFGANITAAGQSTYTGKDGKKHLSAINKLHEEGEWRTYSKLLPSQFLAKQPKQLIKKQLDLTYADKEAELAEINSINNETIKKHFLREFADECDSAAVHLKAASLPRTAYQVLLPVQSLKDNEIYAPNYRDGEKVALIRFPHGGTFEIPILTVTTKNKEAEKYITKSAVDAVGINQNVAERLSGADFDGDDVLVIPTGRNVKIQSAPRLDALTNFSPNDYGYDDIKIGKDGNPHYYRNGKEYKIMSEKYKQKQMGVVSNLITDMTIKGASKDEIAKAVKHSMVVIDSVKHKLDYRQSEVDNDISYLRKKYQGHLNEETGKINTGASTLLSKSSSEIDIPKRRGSQQINPETGEAWYKTNDRTYVNKQGVTVVPTQKSTQMAEKKNAYDLSSGSVVEGYYADYANKMKALANASRKEYLNTKGIKYQKSAAETYSNEVSSLKAKLNEAMLNSPRERMAMIIANSNVDAKVASNPDLKDDKKELMKVKTQELIKARAAVGSSSGQRKIRITDKEWEAIQAGAISHTILNNILMKADADELRERATPRNFNALSEAQASRARAMRASGYTIQQIADAMHVSTTTVSKRLKS